MTDALGLSEYYTAYDANNNLLQKRDRRGFLWNYTYDAQGNLLTAKDPTSATATATYNSHNRPLTKTDALSNKTTLTYDGQDNLLTTAVSSSPGAATAFSTSSKVGGYANGLPTTFTDAYQFQSGVAYDPNGNVTSATDANGITTSATFNILGWKLTSTDALKRVTRYTYDNWGRPIVLTAPDGTQAGTVYDPDGSVLRAADADAYAAAPLYAVHCGGGAVGRFSADAYGSGGYVFTTASAVDTNGVAAPAPAALYQTERAGTFTYAFPNLTPGRLYTLRLHFAELSRSGPGLMQFNAAVNGAPALANYDPWAAGGGMFKASVAEFTPAADGNGQLAVSFTSGAGDVPTCSGIEVLPFVHTVANNYDGDGRLTSSFAGTGDGNGDVVSYAYDGTDPLSGAPQRGLLSAKTDGNGHTTRYSYSPRNEPAATFYADGTAESVTYDEGGNVRTRTKADGKVIRYVYDADNRLSDTTYPALPALHFDYDAGGRRTHMHDGNGDTYWTYGDGLHLTQLQSGRGTVFYDYYLTGPRWHMTAPGVNPSSSLAAYTYAYDPGLRLTGLTDPFGQTTSFAYNDDGTVRQKSLANGAYISYWYDPANAQMTDLQFAWPGLGGSYSHHYTYTPGGSLASRSESDGATNAFTYDGSDQLTREARTPGGFDRSYTYDHNGNRLTQTQNGALTQSFTYDAHDKLTGGINESESYDANGNLLVQTLNGQTTRFGWDDEGRLTGQTFADGHSDLYGYTGLGMRLTKTDPTGGYSYLADGVSPASPVLSDGRTSFTPGISETHGTGNGSYASVFYLADAQGNSRGLLDGGQTNTDGYNWDAFGNLVSRAGSNPTAYAWNEEAGYQSDADSGLKLLGNRYYDSRTGRFLSQDPIGDGDNWYGYCGNDPMNAVDPEGLEELPPTDDPNVPSDFWNHPELYGGANPGDTYRGWTWTGSGWTEGSWSPSGSGSGGAGGDGAGVGGAGGSGAGSGSGSSSGDDGGPSTLQAVGDGLEVGFSAVGSAASFHLWDGGSAKNDPSFGVSRELADVGVAAGTAAVGGAAGTLGTVERSGQTLVTHWDTEVGLANIAKNGLKEGAWLMKGKPNVFNWIRTGKFLNYKYRNNVSGWLPDNTVTQQQVDIVQRILGHFRYWPGVF